MPGWMLTVALLAAAQDPAAPAQDDARRLDAIEVVARSPRAAATLPQAVARLGADEVGRIAPTHANELFARVPGAWVSRGSGQESLIAIRSPVLTGAGACGAFLLLEDGIPIRPAGFCNVNALFELDFEQAGAVEVLRGPGTAVHGSNALHGVINVRPRAPDAAPGTAFGLEGGAHGYARLTGTRAGVLAPWRLDALAARADDFRDDAGFRQGKFYLQRFWPRAAGAPELHLSGHALDQDTAGFVLGQGAYRDARRFANLDPDAFREAHALRAHARWRFEAAPGELLLTPYARHERMRFLQHFLPGTPLEDSGSDSAGVQAQWLHRGTRGELAFGLDAEYARGELLEVQDGPVEDGPPALRAIRPPGRHYDYAVAATQLAGFVRGALALGAGTRLEAGLRVERLRYGYDTALPPGNLAEDGSACGSGGCLFNRPADREDGFTEPATELGMVHALDARNAVFARGARAFRMPQATELYRLQRGQDVADLAPEKLEGFELGWRFADAGLALELAAFDYDKRNVILRDAEGFNVSDGRTAHRGIEAALDWSAGNWWLGGNLSCADHRYRFDRDLGRGEAIRSGDRVDTAPPWLGGLRVGAESPRLGEFEFEAVHVGSHFIDAANSARYPGHTLLHLRWHRELAAGFSLSARLMNLADRRYAERADFAFGDYRYFPGAGRRLSLELRYSAP